MESYRYIRKLYFLFVLFLYIYICGLRDAGILNDLGRSNYKDSKAHLSEDNLVRFLALANGLASRPWCKWRVESTCDSVYTGVACTCDVTWLG